MAIKPITNDNAPNESSINRAEQTTIRSDIGLENKVDEMLQRAMLSVLRILILLSSIT